MLSHGQPPVAKGIYGQAWLDGIGAWDNLRTRLAETDNVRAALVLVARGEAPLGLVYASDAAASATVSVLWTIARDAHPPIRYAALALTPNGVALLAHIRAQSGLFEAAGFEVLP